VIVGAGASGVLTALHLLALPGDAPARVVLIERAGNLGAGVAFSTGHESHLLNVTAALMSAFADDPGHFVRWLDRQGVPGAKEAFVPRKLFGEYLRDTLSSRACPGRTADVVEVLQEEVVDIGPGTVYADVFLSSGRSLRAEAVVLALGIVPPRFPDCVVGPGASDRCLSSPWEPAALARIGPSETVTLVGTGLSAVDVLLALREDGHRGPVHAISRHGLLPQVHAARSPCDPGLTQRCQELRAQTARALLHQVRQLAKAAQAHGGDWRDVIDQLRPSAQALWLGLGAAEQLRFARHVERFWKVHRHRMAPGVGREVERLTGAGLFHVHAGHITSVGRAGSSLSVEAKLRPAGQAHRWTSDWLVNCAGPDPHVFRDGQVLLTRLRHRRLAGPGPLGIGVGTARAGTSWMPQDGRRGGCGRSARSAKASCSRARPCPRSGHKPMKSLSRSASCWARELWPARRRYPRAT
jgi:uncharacterized NAD(P)/FAD-binding protein YdhS